MAPRPATSDANVELIKKLGNGGFGITWQAYDYVTRKEVAIKIYRPADWAEEGPDGRVSLRSEEHRNDYEWGLKRFLGEGQLLRTVSHQAVVRVHRHGHGYGSAYLVMELIAGQSLREHMKRTQPARDIQTVRRLMLDLCAGLDAIHRAGIVHRDVKPGNVMLRASGQPVLIDFGSARQRSQDRTRSMTAIVTPGYAPLEQYDRNGHQGPWTDLYALAAMGHEMLLGHRPGDAAGRVANPELEPLDDLERRTGPSRTINAIRRGLAVQASERPQTCEEMVRLLTEKPVNGAVRSRGTQFRPLPAGEQAGPKRERGEDRNDRIRTVGKDKDEGCTERQASTIFWLLKENSVDESDADEVAAALDDPDFTGFPGGHIKTFCKERYSRTTAEKKITAIRRQKNEKTNRRNRK